jgi:hypothetical protein
MAPLMAVLVLAGYCCWSESDEPIVIPGKEHAAKIEMTRALLSPVSTPAPVRNPFPSAMTEKKAPTAVQPVKESLMKKNLAQNTSHLVLRATFISGDRRLAMINGKFYGEGDIVAAVPHELEVKRLGPDQNNPDGPIIPIKTAGPIYSVAKVFEDRVVLQCENERTELKFLPTDGKSKPGSGTGIRKQPVKGGS